MPVCYRLLDDQKKNQKTKNKKNPKTQTNKKRKQYFQSSENTAPTHRSVF